MRCELSRRQAPKLLAAQHPPQVHVLELLLGPRGASAAGHHEETSGRRPRRASQRSFLFLVLIAAVAVRVLGEVERLGVLLDRVHSVLYLFFTSRLSLDQ